MDEDRRILVNEGDDDDIDELELEFQGGSGGKERAAGEENCLNIVYLSSIVAAIGGLLFGYDVGVISGAKVQVAHEMHLSCGEEEALVSFMPFGALGASLVASTLLDRFGRRATIQVTALVFTAGSLVLAFAESLVVLLIGRFLVGFAVSLSAMSECMYISEISKPSNRGMLITLNELGITVGFLLAFLVNYILMDAPGGWRVMFGLTSGLAIVQFAALFFLPRTPHFLVLRNEDEEATRVLRRLGRTGSVRQELANIRNSSRHASNSTCSQLFSSQDNMRWRTFVGLGLVTLLQVTGQPNILYYATDIFQAVGFCGDTLSAMASIGLGLVKVCATVVSLVLVDKVGRRTLLLLGAVLMSASLLLLTLYAGYQYTAAGYHQRETCTHLPNSTHHHKNPFSHVQHLEETSNIDVCAGEGNLPAGIRYIAFTALVTYVAAFSLSFGPVTWILLTELFPVNLKGNAMSLGQAVNWTANVAVSVTFLDAVRVLTLPAVFSAYFLFSIAAIIFIYYCVPETKGKSLEEISKDLNGCKQISRPQPLRVQASSDKTVDFQTPPYENSFF